MSQGELNKTFVTIVNTAVFLQGSGKLKEAIELYEQALRIMPSHAVVLSNYGNALRRVGRHADALSNQRNAVKLDPRNSRLLANLALAERAAGKPFRNTLFQILNESLAEIDTKMWAAMTLGQPERAFAFKHSDLSILDYAEFPALYQQADLRVRIQTLLPAMGGSIPHDDRRPLVYAAMDGEYAAIFAYDLVSSALNKSLECSVHLHLMNPGSFSLSGFPGDRVTCSTESMPADKTLYSTRRFIRLAQVIAGGNGERHVVALDGDSVLNQDIFAALPPQFDVLIYDRPDETCLQQMISAAFIAVTPAGRAFVNFLAAYLLRFEENGNTKWYADQLAMIAARAWFQKNVPYIDIGAVPPHFMDWSADLNPQSVIWTAKGKNKSRIAH